MEEKINLDLRFGLYRLNYRKLIIALDSKGAEYKTISKKLDIGMPNISKLIKRLYEDEIVIKDKSKYRIRVFLTKKGERVKDHFKSLKKELGE